MAEFGATARTWRRGSQVEYGMAAVVDNQGNASFCTRYSLAKGATDACDHLGIDVAQRDIATALVQEHKDFEGKNPVAFNGKVLLIPDIKSEKWYTMTISVEEIEIEYFKLTCDKKCGTFLLGTDGHCVYAREWRPREGKVKCLNSWGKGQDKEEEPLIDPGEIDGMWRVSIRLEDEKTKIIKQTPTGPFQDLDDDIDKMCNDAKEANNRAIEDLKQKVLRIA